MEVIQTEVVDSHEHHSRVVDYKTAETFGMIVIGLTRPEVTFPELADSSIDADKQTLAAA